MKIMQSIVSSARERRDITRPALISAQQRHLLAPTSATTATMMSCRAVDADAVRHLRVAEQALARELGLQVQRQSMPDAAELEESSVDMV